MIGFLTHHKCAVCNGRLWFFARKGVAAFLCGPCDTRAA